MYVLYTKSPGSPRAIQQASLINELDYGTGLNAMLFQDDGDIPNERFIMPRIEVELAFILAKPPTDQKCTIFDVSIFNVCGATDYLIPVLELIDAHSQSIDLDYGQPGAIT